MKALRNFSLLIVALITLSACTTEEYYTEPGYQEDWFVEDFEIKSGDWVLVGGVDDIGSYYKYDFKGYVDSDKYNNGVVSAYLYTNFQAANEKQTPLPCIEYGHHVVNGNDEYYSIQLTYEVKADGTITFKAYISDFFTGSFDPGTLYFRVVAVA